MAEEKVKPIVQAFDVDAFDFPDEVREIDPTADAHAPYKLAPAGLYFAKIGYFEKDKGIRKETFPAQKGKEELSVLAFTADIVLTKPADPKLAEILQPEDYENQHAFYRANNLLRRDSGVSKFTELIACADPDFEGGSMKDSQIAGLVHQLLSRGFEGVVEIDWEGYNANTEKSKRGMTSFPKDKDGKRIARYRDVDGTEVDARLTIKRLIPAAALRSRA